MTSPRDAMAERCRIVRSLKVWAVAAPLRARGPAATRDYDAYSQSVDVACCNARVSSWQCAPKARIISGGGFHPDNCRLNPEAGERLGWVTGRVGASRQRSPWAAERSGGP